MAKDSRFIVQRPSNGPHAGRWVVYERVALGLPLMLRNSSFLTQPLAFEFAHKAARNELAR